MNMRPTRSSIPSPTWLPRWMSGMRMSSLPTFPAGDAVAACHRPVVKEIEIPHWVMRGARNGTGSRGDSTRTTREA